jgi:hypothetical protein
LFRRLAVLSGALALYAYYMVTETGTLRVVECSEFSWSAPNRRCRAAPHWAAAVWVFLAGAVIFAILQRRSVRTRRQAEGRSPEEPRRR